jgi:hypothetical protein
LTRAVETIIAEDSGVSVRKRIVELEEDKTTLQCAVDNAAKDYDLLIAGNNSLLAECNDLKYRCEDLEKELTEARSDTKERIDDQEIKVKSAEAYSIDIAAVGEKRLNDFQDRLVWELEGLRELCAHNV